SWSSWIQHHFTKKRHVIGGDVCNALKELFDKGKLLGELNATLITLVPKKALEAFSDVSGLYPNLDKSTIFCESMDKVSTDNVLNILLFKRGKLSVRYLGVPLVAKEIGVKDCKSLIDKVKDRIHDWKNKSLSYAGRAQLIAYVLASIQVYWASIFKLPKATLDQWNNALLVKHLWNVAAKKDSLWVRWVNVVILKGMSVWEIEKQTNDSWTWKSLLDLKDVTRKHMQYKVGNGNKVSMWHDKWSKMPPIDSILSRREIYAAGFSNEDSITDCVCNNGWKWLAEWFIMYPILNQYPVPMLNNDVKDRLIWCSNNGSTNAFGLWMATKGKLVTQDKMSKWYPAWEKMQTMTNVENLKDLEDFMSKLSILPCKNSIWSIVRRLCIADTVYHLWLERNARLFQQKEKCTKSILHLIRYSVCSRLMTVRVKNSNAVKEVEDKWGIQLMKKVGTSKLDMIEDECFLPSDAWLSIFPNPYSEVELLFWFLKDGSQEM
ncbi:hypothetical protein Tco_0195000, partial [Tanacetum coccineum]